MTRTRMDRFPGRAAALALVLAAAVLAGCASGKPWINAPLPPEEQNLPVRKSERDPTMLVAITLSGGGARAAAFGFGVLTAMQETRYHWNGAETTLLDVTDVVSGVSGGSIVAAYLAAHGIDGLPRFEQEFLRDNFQNSLITQALRPGNLADLTSPWLGRSHLLARRLDDLYKGMTFGDVVRRPRHPQLFITATDMSLGAGFEFTWEQFALICSDLRSVPLSFAVASSSAVPLLLSPMTLRNYADRCPPRQLPPRAAAGAAGAPADYRARLYRAHELSYTDAKSKPYIHLVDGGLADNLGVQRLLDRALAGGGLRQTFSEVGIPPATIRKLVLITVNAERDPSERIEMSDRVPNMAQVVDALLFGSGARATRETQEFLRDITRQWRQALASGGATGTDAFAPDAEIHVIPVNLRDAPDDVARRRLLQVPTAFSITQDEVTDLITAGGSVLRNAPEFRELLQSLEQRPAPAGLQARD